MKRALVSCLVLFAAAACESPATEAELRELVACSDRWDTRVPEFELGVTMCEAPCADGLEVQLDEVGECIVDVESRFLTPAGPGRSFCKGSLDRDWRGRVGCCIPDEAPVRFVECKVE